ncbi:MAG: hypothetical protein PHC64_01820 [Candidatus Gastranaerophilales bacterium]|nr:hypothetical protein [Candidatus Gastranaerophilales bacterium]
MQIQRIGQSPQSLYNPHFGVKLLWGEEAKRALKRARIETDTSEMSLEDSNLLQFLEKLKEALSPLIPIKQVIFAKKTYLSAGSSLFDLVFMIIKEGRLVKIPQHLNGVPGESLKSMQLKQINTLAERLAESLNN